MKMRRTIFTAFSSCLFLAFAQFAGAIAKSQQVSDPRVADLVQRWQNSGRGTLRYVHKGSSDG